MKQGRSLQDLAKELERQNKTKRDFVSSMGNLKVRSEWRDKPNPADGGVQVLLGKEKFKLNELANDQLARRLEIPSKYYDRMRHDAPGLLEQNVNHWLQAKETDKVMVRTLGGNARAFLSDRYRPLDNYDMAESVLPTLSEMKVEVVSCEVTDQHLYIKAVTEKITAEITKGDVVQAGIVVSNSEVGLGAVKVEPMVYRLVCLNGMIRADSSLRKYHVGRGDESDANLREYYASETRIADDKAFWLKCRDVVRGALNKALFQKLVDRMKETTQNKISGNLQAVMEEVSNKYPLSEGESSGILNHLMKGNDLNQYALVNAVTRASQDTADYERATDLERIGGDILELRGRSWETIATAMNN